MPKVVQQRPSMEAAQHGCSAWLWVLHPGPQNTVPRSTHTPLVFRQQKSQSQALVKCNFSKMVAMGEEKGK